MSLKYEPCHLGPLARSLHAAAPLPVDAASTRQSRPDIRQSRPDVRQSRPIYKTVTAIYRLLPAQVLGGVPAARGVGAAPPRHFGPLAGSLHGGFLLHGFDHVHPAPHPEP